MDSDRYSREHIPAETAHFRLWGYRMLGYRIQATTEHLGWDVHTRREVDHLIDELIEELHNLQRQLDQAIDPGLIGGHRGIPRIIREPGRRTGLSLRFAIFQRDNYRCQICGRSAQDGVTLEVDHRVPRAKGGLDIPTNLWTLCFDCNRGKSDTDL